MRNIIKSCATVLTAMSIQLLTALYCAAQALPEADLMDIVFNADGTAHDVSRLHLTVDKDGAPRVTYNEKLGRNVAEFTHPWCVSSKGETNKGTTFYRVQYGDSPSFESAIAEGFSVELLVKASGAPAESPDTESKAFSSTQGGGACIGVKVKEKDGMNGWNFFINVTPSGTKKGTWIFANTNIYPTPDKWYHIIGVWNKEYLNIYIDGELIEAAEAEAEGEYTPSNTKWWGIGADPSGVKNGVSTGTNNFQGAVAIARVYSAKLNAGEAQELYKAAINSGTTGMAEITSGNSDTPVKTVYNLQGIRIDKITSPGLYIVNGKKVFLK